MPIYIEPDAIRVCPWCGQTFRYGDGYVYSKGSARGCTPQCARYHKVIGYSLERYCHDRCPECHKATGLIIQREFTICQFCGYSPTLQARGYDQSETSGAERRRYYQRQAAAMEVAS